MNNLQDDGLFIVVRSVIPKNLQDKVLTNSTGDSSYHRIIGRNIRTRLDLMVSSKQNPQNNIKDQTLRTRFFHSGDRVLDYNDRGETRRFGEVLSKEGNFIYNLKMYNGMETSCKSNVALQISKII